MHSMTPAQIEDFGAELDAIRAAVLADLGDKDAAYIRRVVDVQRKLEVTGRALLLAGRYPPAWVAGTAALAVSKILDNMEIGHNVMHGQYDWMNDPELHSRTFEWDTVAPSAHWKHSHNYEHHTYTNIVGKDRDVGYGILRITDEQRWHPYYLGNPVYAAALAVLFEWGVMAHDLEVDKLRSGEKSLRDVSPAARAMLRKAGRQVLKDYVLFPALSGRRGALPTLTGNATANLVRNLWAFAIIFCGHFPDGVATFSPLESADETRGQWYLRQLQGSANIRGGKLFHLMSGNLSHQIEHHLFPDLPARRYAEIAPQVRDVCRRYGLRYNTGGFSHQLFTVARKIVKLALPGRSHERDFPGDRPARGARVGLAGADIGDEATEPVRREDRVSVP